MEQTLIWEPLAPGGWRLCDSQYPVGQVQRLVAYVERGERGGYEAVWIARRSAPTWHTSRADVLREAQRTAGSVPVAADAALHEAVAFTASDTSDRHRVLAA
ncbi:hypothetical protein M3147_10250 [Agromyces mediolanus]|uniref:hypothetical protein n=1 Tax=Agromyces mediolanus TaxID=41986 RepID=UPI0020400F75|nr:hypothetical protein [Agromyces mediolanus]MCM3657631.1 hypothetical protein [Agromyces mediolanus]